MPVSTCPNGHDPEYVTVRENGTRNCQLCANRYHIRRRKHSQLSHHPGRADNENVKHTR